MLISLLRVDLILGQLLVQDLSLRNYFPVKLIPGLATELELLVSFAVTQPHAAFSAFLHDVAS